MQAPSVLVFDSTAFGYVREKGIGIAIISSNWFFNFPDSWVRLGRIHLSRARATTPETAVDFYATAPDYADSIRAALTAFAKSLPSRIRLEIEPAPAPLASGATH